MCGRWRRLKETARRRLCERGKRREMTYNTDLSAGIHAGVCVCVWDRAPAEKGE